MSDLPVVPSVDVAVQLAHIEGRINLILDRDVSTERRVNKLESIAHMLESSTQALEEGAKSSKETAEALALALKEANMTAENSARKERENETSKREQLTQAQAAATQAATVTWSPWARVIVILGTLATVVGVLYQFSPGRG